MNNLMYVSSGNHYPLAAMPIKPTKVEIPGEEWEKLNNLLQERERMVQAKTIFIEQGYSYKSDGRQQQTYNYKTASEDESIRLLTKALQEAEDLKNERKDTLERLEAEYKDKLEKELEIRSSNYIKLYQRGFWARVFNRIPK